MIHSAGYLSSVSYSWEPRLSLQWLGNMSLIKDIISIPPPPAADGGDPAFLVDLVIPRQLQRSFLGCGLQHQSKLVVQQMLVLLLAVFQKLEALAANIQDKGCFAKVAQLLRKRLPDVQLLLALLQTHSSTLHGVSSEPVHEIASCSANCLLWENTIRLLHRYYRHLPETVLATGFSLTKLVPSAPAISISMHLPPLFALLTAAAKAGHYTLQSITGILPNGINVRKCEHQCAFAYRREQCSAPLDPSTIYSNRGPWGPLGSQTIAVGAVEEIYSFGLGRRDLCLALIAAR